MLTFTTKTAAGPLMCEAVEGPKDQPNIWQQAILHGWQQTDLECPEPGDWAEHGEEDVLADCDHLLRFALEEVSDLDEDDAGTALEYIDRGIADLMAIREAVAHAAVLVCGGVAGSA